MSYWSMAYMGGSPFGSLLAGILAPVLGAPGTVLLFGLGALGAIWSWHRLPKLRADIRPIYRKPGILPFVPEEAAPVSGSN
jgi:hypothetical protein